MRQRTLVLRQIYKEGTAALKEKKVPDAALDAWLLLSYVTGVSKALYYGNPDAQVQPEKAEEYFRYIEMRGRRIPLQHITGEQEFMGLTFHVNEHVLVPRQDTEILVEECLKILKPGMRILDMCTGSGCILLSLLKLGKEKAHAGAISGHGMDISGAGTDISEEALSVANRNMKKLGILAEFLKSDLFENVEGKFDIIVSNPPYIPTEEIETLQEEVRLYDPRIALDGGGDGLYFYREIVRESVRYIKDGGHLMFEIGCGQGEEVSFLMAAAGYRHVQVIKDLAGLDRVAVGVYYGK